MLGGRKQEEGPSGALYRPCDRHLVSARPRSATLVWGRHGSLLRRLQPVCKALTGACRPAESQVGAKGPCAAHFDGVGTACSLWLPYATLPARDATTCNSGSLEGAGEGGWAVVPGKGQAALQRLPCSLPAAPGSACCAVLLCRKLNAQTFFVSFLCRRGVLGAERTFCPQAQQLRPTSAVAAGRQRQRAPCRGRA